MRTGLVAGNKTMPIGTVSKVWHGGHHGFIAIDGERGTVFFSASELSDDIEFNNQLVGRKLRFETEWTDRGRQAIAIQPVDEVR
jgi:cold shock CspA family protein